jgi:CheY-like chemotaxis protein
MPLRCVIVDDNAGFLRSARLLLEREGISVVAVASTSYQALRVTEALRPDFVLVDINLDRENGFELASRLHSELGVAPSDLILISTHAEDDFADLIATSPAVGFISKSYLSARAIRQLRNGEGDGDPPPTEPPGT